MLFYAFLRPHRRGGKNALFPRRAAKNPEIAQRNRRKHGTAPIVTVIVKFWRAALCPGAGLNYVA